MPQQTDLKLQEMTASEQPEELKKPSEKEEQPPILGSWKNLYLLVIGNLIFLIVLFYLFTRYFS